MINRIVLIVAISLLIGCNDKDGGNPPIPWNGKDIREFHGKTMVSMLWLRPTKMENINFKYVIYKRFDNNDFQMLLQFLDSPERPSIVQGEAWNEKLYLSFLDGSHYLINFNIRDKTIILPNGYSKNLYTLLMGKEISAEYDPKKDIMAGSIDPNEFMKMMQ
jgi:hypothetical protein